jgi:hypothetical protein
VGCAQADGSCDRLRRRQEIVVRTSFVSTVLLVAGIAALGVVASFAASSDTTLKGGDQLRVACGGTQLTTTRIDAKTIMARCVAAASPSATATAIATATATSSPTPTTVAVLPTSTATASPTLVPGGATTLAGCPVFPSDNVWNQDVSHLPVDPRSASYIANINAGRQFLHADFGSNPTYGIPFVVVPSNQPNVPINFTAYGDESDPGPYPVPGNAPVEGGSSSSGDRHVLVLQQGVCKLYEMFRAFPNGSGWNADAGAIFDLRSNALRPAGWTSADAAGLPILPGLVRFDEVAAGQITHALRFTVSRTQRAYIHPATHWASSSTDPNLAPMGLRLRLRADFDTSHFTGEARVLLEGLKKYGMMVADNGSDWFITGATDPRWNDTDLNQLKTVPGSAFEVVQTGTVVK